MRGSPAALRRASTSAWGLPSELIVSRPERAVRARWSRRLRIEREPPLLAARRHRHRSLGDTHVGPVRGRTAARRPAGDLQRRRRDLGGIDAGLRRHAAGQRGELHRLAEGDRLAAVDRLHRQVVERHVERHVGGELHEPARDARLLGELDQVLAPLLLLDVLRHQEQRLEVAVLVEELRGGLRPDARARPARCRWNRRPAPAARSSSPDRRRTSPSRPRGR